MLARRKDLPELIRNSPEEIRANGSDPQPQIELALNYQSLRMILHQPCMQAARMLGGTLNRTPASVESTK